VLAVGAPPLQRRGVCAGLEYVDLFLMHFPLAQRFVPFEIRYPPEWVYDPDAPTPTVELAPVPLASTWAAMEEALPAGLARNIGVCNFNTALLRDLLASATQPPSVLQVELHPYNQQPKLVRFAAQHGIAVTGFSPLGAGSYVELGMAGEQDSALRDPVIQSIAERLGNQRPRPPPPSPSPLSPPPPALLTAERHEKLGAPVGVSAAQVVLRWAVQRGYSVETAEICRNSEIRRDLPRFATEAILPPSEERSERGAFSGLQVVPKSSRPERLAQNLDLFGTAHRRCRRVQRSSGCRPSRC